jgi:hypothetical protein
LIDTVDDRSFEWFTSVAVPVVGDVATTLAVMVSPNEHENGVG